MKKQYIIPAVDLVEAEYEQMLAASTPLLDGENPFQSGETILAPDFSMENILQSEVFK